MAAIRNNIEIVTLPMGAESPYCLHGPTILFERLDSSSKKPRQFYACSAFRDKKSCSFFQWADENTSKCTASIRNETEKSHSHKKLRERFYKFKKLARNLRHICCTCGLLLLEEESVYHESQGHSLRHRVGLQELKHPTRLFIPLDDNKTYAQYLFTKTTVDFFIDSVMGLHFTHILCVGAPRIHEEVQLRRKHGADVTSLLLDLDERYAQVYPPSAFVKYNMFNHHFFEKMGCSKLSKFLSDGSEHVVLITDPPFGGMVEALAGTFTKLSHLWTTSCGKGSKEKLISLIWIFPYFMEKRIVTQLPEMSMLDYKVDYENHILFNNQHLKKGSPVRIFTNISQSLFTLPQNEGYWFCQTCQRYSSKENWHCKDCGTCTSKDGTCYVHCDACMRCVKPSRVHCFTCQMCQLKDHVCGQPSSPGCHICGGLDHKRRQCPQRMLVKSEESNSQERKLKRKIKSSGTKHRKKARRN